MIDLPTTTLVDASIGRLATVARALTAGPAPHEIVEIVVRQGMAGLGADGAVLALLGPNDRVETAATAGSSTRIMDAIGPLRLDDEFPLAVAARTATAVWLPNRAECSVRYPALARAASRSQAWAAVPLAARNRVFGALGISFLEPCDFAVPERDLILALADVTALALSAIAPSPAAASVALVCDAKLAAAMNHIYSASLTVASVLARRSCDADTSDRLHEAIALLDGASRELREGTNGS